MRILLAEDDYSQAESIKTWLEMDGYSVDWVDRGDYAIHAIEQHQYDCILLDRGLPQATGDDILKTIRTRQQGIPVIFITARDSIHDRVEGLDLGANDYLSKPFSTKELIARIKVMLKENVIDDSYLQYQDILLNKKEETLACKNTKYQLTKLECSILSLLIRSESNRVPIWLVIEKVWNNRVNVNQNTVSLYVSYLNRKLLALQSCVSIKMSKENIELCVNI